MRIQIERGTGTPVYQQIVEQIKQQILSGELAPGYRLPPERQLAQHLSVNRTTVLSAYRELKAQGLVDSKVGSGTSVLPPQGIPQPEKGVEHAPIWEHLFSDYSNNLGSDDVSDMLRLANRRDVISFAAGIASMELRPGGALQGIEEAFLSGGDERALLASPVEGFHSLREAISGYMRGRGCFCGAQDVMVLSGSQQGIDLTARTLINPGDIVVTEEPSFFPALQSFRAAGARVMGVPMTQKGMDLDALEQLLGRYRPKLIYTMPNYHNPCGITMPLEERIRLLELVAKHRVALLEDDPYGELCYDGKSLPTLKSMDKSGFVIYLNTFSKTLYPGLRLGFAVAQPKLLARFAAARQLIDLHANCLSQQIVERFITKGQMAGHIETIGKAYTQRRDEMLGALEKYAPRGLSWNTPQGGYYIWCHLPEGIAARELARAAARKGVAILPGDAFFVNPAQGRGYIRLNYTFARQGQIETGIAMMCEALKELMEQQSLRQVDWDGELSPIV